MTAMIVVMMVRGGYKLFGRQLPTMIYYSHTPGGEGLHWVLWGASDMLMLAMTMLMTVVMTILMILVMTMLVWKDNVDDTATAALMTTRRCAEWWRRMLRGSASMESDEFRRFCWQMRGNHSGRSFRNHHHCVVTSFKRGAAAPRKDFEDKLKLVGGKCCWWRWRPWWCWRSGQPGSVKEESSGAHRGEVLRSNHCVHDHVLHKQHHQLLISYNHTFSVLFCTSLFLLVHNMKYIILSFRQIFHKNSILKNDKWPHHLSMLTQRGSTVRCSSETIFLSPGIV